MISGSEIRNDTCQIDRRGKLERTESPQSVACFPSSVTACPTTTSPSKIDTTTMKKSVSFKKSVRVCFTRSHRNYTPRQRRDCWYGANELTIIRLGNKQDFRHITTSNEPKEENNDSTTSATDNNEEESRCLRGLEAHDERVLRRKLRVRDQAVTTVLAAEAEGCDDIDIADLYSEVSAAPQTWANILGIRDQRIADSIYQEQSE